MVFDITNDGKSNLYRVLSNLDIAQLFERYKFAGELSIKNSLDGKVNLSDAYKMDFDTCFELIKLRNVFDRESYFLSLGKLYSYAFELGKENFVNELRRDLGYFQKCFLDDSNLKNVGIDVNSIKEMFD